MGKYYDNEITPFNDQYMTYDTNTHRYTLTDYAIDESFNANFVTYAKSEDNAKALRNEISADYYKYIYKYNRRDSDKRKTDEHRLAKNGDFREVIRDGMLDMARALIRTGNLIDKDLSWVNSETSTVMDLSSVPPITSDAIDGLFAYGILHKGSYTYSIDDDDYRSDY